MATQAFVNNLLALAHDRRLSIRNISAGAGLSSSTLNNFLTSYKTKGIESASLSDRVRSAIARYLQVPLEDMDTKELLPPVPLETVWKQRNTHGIRNVGAIRRLAIDTVPYFNEASLLAFAQHPNETPDDLHLYACSEDIRGARRPEGLDEELARKTVAWTADTDALAPVLRAGTVVYLAPISAVTRPFYVLAAAKGRIVLRRLISDGSCHWLLCNPEWPGDEKRIAADRLFAAVVAWTAYPFS